MVSLLEEFADDLMTASNSDMIWERTAAFSYDLGFESCSLTLAKGKTPDITSSHMMTDLPEYFCDAYLQDGMISIDPFLLFTCRGLTPSRIVAADLSCFPDASPKHKRLLDLAISSGISKGIGIPVRTLDQGLYGGWVFSTNQSLVTFNRLEKDRSRDLHLAGVLAYERMMAFGLSTDFPNRLLSDRERECLLWLCAGLRVSMIAQRLSISESAIHLYITNAKRKLGAKTREQAIARAIFSGEIEL